MAATLTHLTQRVLKTYTFMDADHPVWQAWADYSHARANALPTRPAATRLRRELALEDAVSAAIGDAA